MKHAVSVPLPVNEKTSQNNVSHQIEDAALKVTAHYFADVLLPYFNIDGKVHHIAPTEIVHLELKKLYQDFNFVMNDGSWTHFEFQSTDNKALDDLKRFWAYEALTTLQHNVEVRTYVLYSGTITNPLIEFTSGFNTYRVQPIIMKGHRAEEVFENITYKIAQSIPLTREDLVPLTLCPLMGGDIPQKERILKAFQIVQYSKHVIPDAEKIEAVIYAMANKFLNTTELEHLKEEIKMTELGSLIYNDGKADGLSEGIAQGIEKEAMENAENLFKNGSSYELVRSSIRHISDEMLRNIYDRVMASKKV